MLDPAGRLGCVPRPGRRQQGQDADAGRAQLFGIPAGTSGQVEGGPWLAQLDQRPDLEGAPDDALFRTVGPRRVTDQLTDVHPAFIDVGEEDARRHPLLTGRSARVRLDASLGEVPEQVHPAESPGGNCTHPQDFCIGVVR
jgi:hypothetical protein